MTVRRSRFFKVDRASGELVELKDVPVPERSCATWPQRSTALGVHPRQCGEAYEASVRMGVPTRFDEKTGEAILESRHHRRRYAEAFGIYDMDGGFSDPQQHKERFDVSIDASEYEGV